jgi:hypothetical protein
MGATLTGQIVSETYDSLLKVTDNGVITGTKKRVTDGYGNDTPLLLSSTDVQIDGNLLLSGTTSQYVRGDGAFATFTSGLTSVGLTLGSSGTDASVSGSPLTSNGAITLNLPTASATNRGLLSSTDWSTFNSKQGALTLTTSGSSGASTLVGSTLNIPNYTLSGLGGVPYTGATADVNLGIYNLTLDALIGATADFTSSGSGNTFEITHSSGSGIALNIEKGGNGEGLYINKTSGSGNAATIIGTLNATTLVKSGGTSSQFLKADGSVDSTTYTPTTRTLTINGTAYDLSADRSWTIAGSGISTLNTLTASTQTFAVGTSGSDFNISSATSTHTFNIPDAGASARGLITTGTQTIAGAKTFSGATTFSSTINANSSIAGSGGWNAQTNTSVGSVNSSTYALLGSNLCSFKQYVYTSTTSLSAGSNHATLLIASSALFEAVSGTHAIVSQLAIKPITLSNGTATTTNGATLYIEGPASGTASITNNYALWVDDGATRLDGGLLALNQFNRQTASYTLVLSDWGKIVEMNVASANTLTIPTNASVAFPIGTEIQVLQYGAGQTTIAGAGVTFRSKSGQLKIGNQYTGVTLVKVGTDEWYVIGNVSA